MNSTPPSLQGFQCEQQLIHYLEQATSIASFFQRIQTLIRRSGLTHFFFMLLSAPVDAQAYFGTPVPALRLKYNEGMYYIDDMVLQHAMTSDTPIYFSNLVKFLKASPVVNRLIRRNKKIALLIAESGLIDIYSIPFLSCGGRHALFSVAATEIDPTLFIKEIESIRSDLQNLAAAIDIVGHKNFSERFGEGLAGPLLTPKPIRLLAALANDNVDLNQAADRLGISISTANQHIATAKRVLGAHTTSSAITRAIRLGLIQIQ